MPLLPWPPHILLALVSAGLGAHQIFRRFEPDNLAAHLALLTLPPALFSVVLQPHAPLLAAISYPFAIYFSTIVISVVVYRLSPFHPLAGYPGPLCLKVSKLSLIWIASQGAQHKFINQLHERYGDVVRTGPNEVSIRDVDALPSASTIPKDPRYGFNSKMAFSNSLSLIAERNPIEHARRRKPWNRAFNASALKGYEEIIAKRANALAEALAAQKDEIDLGKWFAYFIYDLMSDMTFGGGSEMIRDGRSGSTWHVLEEGIVYFHAFGQIPWASLYLRRIPAIARTTQRLVAQGRGLAIQRVNNGSLSRDLFYYLNNEDGAETVTPPFAETVSNGVLAMIAGSDTTTSVLSTLFYFILADRAVYERLQAEVDRYFPAGEDPLDTKHHASMPFLNAVINESLRLYPVVADGSQRRVPKGSGGRAAGSYYLPEGTTTYVHLYSLQRDPRYFSDPDVFYPDRWLPGAADADPNFVHDTRAYAPFSFGPNNCVGRGLALQEMRMLAALLLRRFEMRFLDGWDARKYEEGLKDWFVLQKPALRVVLTPRGIGAQ